MTTTDPMRCDHYGAPLDVGDSVKLIDEYDEHPTNVGPHRTGVIRATSRAGTDQYGTFSVAFDGAARPHRVPNTALVKRAPTSDTHVLFKARKLAESIEGYVEAYVMAEHQYRVEANAEVDVSDKTAQARDDLAVRLVADLLPVWSLLVPQVTAERMTEIIEHG